ncbi:MAG: hypothetical protein FJZ01_25075, partial [Candidatus Sericytochromatia bacterium]|nr:hypothetical protein [Candidatus Tanganyikabacteria bacterium]
MKKTTLVSLATAVAAVVACNAPVAPTRAPERQDAAPAVRLDPPYMPEGAKDAALVVELRLDSAAWSQVEARLRRVQNTGTPDPEATETPAPRFTFPPKGPPRPSVRPTFKIPTPRPKFSPGVTPPPRPTPSPRPKPTPPDTVRRLPT